MTASGELAGRVTVITGGGRGIGRATALAFAEAGAAVMVTARSADEIEETASLIEAAGGRAAWCPADVTDLDAVQEVPDSSDRRVRHLLGFARVEAAPGDAVTVDVDCDLTPISRRDPATRAWSVRDGDWQVVAAQQRHDPAATSPVTLPN